MRDIDALRFVWREKPEDELLDYAMLVHLFGKVDSPCISNWSIKKAADNVSLDAKFAINSNFYMDDFLKSMSNENDLVKLVREVISVLNSCGFRLNKFISNSTFVLESLPKTKTSSKYVNLDLNSLISERTSGLIWNIENDTFTFKPVIKDLPNTKRGILSIVSSVFDPLGILNPSLIEAKYIIQQLWREKIDWNKPTPTYLNKRWNLSKHEMNSISTISVPRWFGFHSSLTNEIELHIYCDASQIAYGAVAYLRCLEENANQYSVRFVLSKSRLTPMKDRTLTIPKLESQAAMLATRLKVSV